MSKNPVGTDRSPQALWNAWNRLWNGDYGIADEYLSRTMRVNIPEFGMPDPATLDDGPRIAAWIAAFRSSFEDDASITGELGPFFFGDYAIGRWVFNGTWTGGRPATATAEPGTRVAFRGVDILRFEDGRIAEYWLTDDQLDLYAQLGAVSGAGTAAKATLPAGLSPEAARAVLVERILELTAELVENEQVSEAPETDTFLTLGLDSLAAVGLRDRLQEEFAVTLPTTMAFAFPSPKALAGHLWTLLDPDAPGDASAGGTDAWDVLARLEYLAAGFTTSGKETERAELAERVSRLAAQLRPATGAEREGIDAASPDELFAYLDARLGPAEQSG